MIGTHVPDLSEWQAGARVDKLPALIIRAHNGYRVDTEHARFRATSHAAVVRGHYGYIVANRDPAQQGREFAAAVGHLSPGEFAAGDLEEGAGDQSSRLEAWAREVDRALGGTAWVYSGESFLTNHLSTVHRPRWVAAYRDTAPRGPHMLWQHTDREPYRLAGLRRTPLDCSIYAGSLARLRVDVDHGQGRFPKPPKPSVIVVHPNPTHHPAVPPFTFPPGLVLEFGATGPLTRALQARLVARGWKLTQSGIYDTQTTATVERFQADSNAHGWPELQVDGRTGPHTWAALWNRPVTP